MTGIDETKDQQIIEITERSIEERVKDFGELLDNIENINDKRKRLWREIYENAVSDRQNSYFMFAKLIKMSSDKTTEWAVHGKTITACVERMSKANDQLIKLAELVDKANSKDQGIDPEAMFDAINKRGR